MILPVLTVVARFQPLRGSICRQLPTTQLLTRQLSVNSAIHHGIRRSRPGTLTEGSRQVRDAGSANGDQDRRPSWSPTSARQSTGEPRERRPNHLHKHDVADMEDSAYSKTNSRTPRHRAFVERGKLIGRRGSNAPGRAESGTGRRTEHSDRFVRHPRTLDSHRPEAYATTDRGSRTPSSSSFGKSSSRGGYEARRERSFGESAGQTRASFGDRPSRGEYDDRHERTRTDFKSEGRFRPLRDGARFSERSGAAGYGSPDAPRGRQQQYAAKPLNREMRRAHLQRRDDDDQVLQASSTSTQHDPRYARSQSRPDRSSNREGYGRNMSAFGDSAARPNGRSNGRNDMDHASRSSRAEDRPRSGLVGRERDSESSWPDTSRRDRTSPRREDRSYGGFEESARPMRASDIPLSLPYTTPASEFLYGTSVVTAALQARTRKMYKLYMYTGENREAVARDDSIRQMAKKAGVEVMNVQGEWMRLMDKMSTGRPHNGYVLESSPLPKRPIEGLGPLSSPQRLFNVSLGHQSREDQAINGTDTAVPCGGHGKRYPLVLMLDGILDPGNLGAIVRSAYFLGVDAIAVSERNSAPFSPTMLKASAGASEHIPFFSVAHPNAFLDSVSESGWKLYAAVAPPSSSSSPSSNPTARYLSTTDLEAPLGKHPSVLLLGGEGEGLRWNLRKKVHFEVGIAGGRAGQSGVDSLNVSVAAGILCQAFLRTDRQSPTHEDESTDRRVF